MRFRMFFCTLSLSVKKLGNVGRNSLRIASYAGFVNPPLGYGQ